MTTFYPPYSKHIDEAEELIRPYIRPTPIGRSRHLDEQTHANLFFKLENMMDNIGAFKARGALYSVLTLTEEEKEKGVVAPSSGNHGLALAWAAQMQKMPAYIVMPTNSSPVKKRGVEEYGGKIIECEPTAQARDVKTQEVQQQTGATLVHPFNSARTILGQATATKELRSQVLPVVDAIVAPVGGGGLISGTALAAREYFGRRTRVIGAEPYEADDAYRSLKEGKLQQNVTANTIADGLRGNVGEIPFSIMQKEVDQIMRVTEEEIIEATRELMERLHVMVEPSGAVAYAAVKRNRAFFRGQRVGIIVSGGNVDLDNLPWKK